ncbi:hypothetical protein [Rhizobium sp. SL86]|uniref:hypothetical protein n=1 Tax=Rhizobium sp. SL86 TaxID=2995148 RepID=UPI002274D986|nr:hypothetical protein [Rhizobium sp. SL86]MCY1664835.1 hypothetical protein [Rhizobium sp. SL86]
MTDGSGDVAAYVRPLEPQDIPAVGRLFVKAFRKRGAATEPSLPLIEHLRQVYVANPWHDPEIPSRVFVDDKGDIRGFVGVNVQRMTFEGRSVRAAFAGSLTVDEPDRHPLAGARLIRSFLSGPQDISITETANMKALRMWQKLGIPPDTQYSLNWIRLLRPATATVGALKHRHGAAQLLFPLARLADTAFARIMSDPFRPRLEEGPRRLTFAETDRAAFDKAALDLARLYPLRPAWDETSIDWFSSHAAIKRNFGEPCYRLAHGRDGKPVAAYAYFRRPNDFAWLLQSLVKPDQAGDLIDDMLADAHRHGCAAVRGAAQPWLNNALICRRTLFLTRTFYLVHAKEKALLAPFRDGMALASGLAGESWMRLIGDHFED